MSSVSPLSDPQQHSSAEAVRAGAEEEEDASGDEGLPGSVGPLCGDGWTKKKITMLIGCGNQGRDMELRSACQEDTDFPKGNQ